MEACSEDSSRIWKNAKSFLGWSSGGPPSKLIQNGNLFTKPRDLTKISNEFFINKVKKLRETIPAMIGDPLERVRSMMANRRCSFKPRACHPDEILDIIKKLNKQSKSCGLDNIDTYVIDLVKEELVPVITHIVNISIQENKFPTKWKCAKVIPLHKKDETTDPKNYRP